MSTKKKGLEVFRKKLTEKKGELVAYFRGHGAVIQSERCADIDDWISDLVPSEVDRHLREQQIKLLGEVRDALARIEGDAFGLCEACGDGMPPNRLEAVPWARFCVSCQARLVEGEDSSVLSPLRTEDAWVPSS